MSLASNLIKWTPKILKASADDIAEFGPNAPRVRALLNMIYNTSPDAARLGNKVSETNAPSIKNALIDIDNILQKEYSTSGNTRVRNAITAQKEVWDVAQNSPLRRAGTKAAPAEVASDLITPEAYRTLTNPVAVSRALDRLAGRAPESFVPTARDLGERGLVSAPADIVTALRISKLPQQQQSLVMGLVDSGMTLEEAMLAARALS
jgi:hypothetical protein